MRVILVLSIALLVAAPVLGDGTVPGDLETVVRRALEARLGSGAEVSIDEIELLAPPNGRVVDARIAPDARLGQPLQIRLATADARGGVAWTGAASVHARIVMTHAHAVHALARGTQMSAADVEPAKHEMTQGPLAMWPMPETLAQGRVLRDLAAGACIGRTAVATVLAVQSGQDVLAVVHIDGVEATARLVAAGSGEPGAIIRVVNQQSRRVMKARVVSAGTVEIVQ